MQAPQVTQASKSRSQNVIYFLFLFVRLLLLTQTRAYSASQNCTLLLLDEGRLLLVVIVSCHCRHAMKRISRNPTRDPRRSLANESTGTAGTRHKTHAANANFGHWMMQYHVQFSTQKLPIFGEEYRFFFCFLPQESSRPVGCVRRIKLTNNGLAAFLTKHLQLQVFQLKDHVTASWRWYGKGNSFIYLVDCNNLESTLQLL